MGSVIFVDTSVFVAILSKESDWRDFSKAIEAAETRLTSPVVRLETCIVLGTRLKLSPREADRQFEKLLLSADIEETPQRNESPRALATECFGGKAFGASAQGRQCDGHGSGLDATGFSRTAGGADDGDGCDGAPPGGAPECAVQ